jgi:DNA-binding beta-propeller fold protein YncE
MSFMKEIVRAISVGWLLTLLFFLLFPAHVLADGGAPQLAYVSGTAHGISIIDILQQKVTDTLPLPGNPATVLLSVDGNILYVTQPELNRVTAVAMKTKQILCTASVAGYPSLLTLDSGTDTLYVAGPASNSVTALNPLNCATRFSKKVSAPVQGLAVANVGNGIAGANGDQLWITYTGGLSVLSSDGTVLARVPVPAHLQYICIPAGPTAYVTTQEGEVEGVDLATRRVLPPLLTGGSFGPMDYDATTGEVYVPDREHNRVDVLAPASNNTFSHTSALRRVIALAAAPQSIAITSDGQLGFIALNDGKVALFDVPGRQVITTFSVGGSPHFIITGLYPSLLNLTPQQSTLLSFLVNTLYYVAALIILLTPFVAIAVQKRRARRHHQSFS